MRHLWRGTERPLADLREAMLNTRGHGNLVAVWTEGRVIWGPLEDIL